MADAKNTLTIGLNGDVHLTDFAKAIDCFRRLIDALSDEVAPGSKVEWHIDSLDAGSAIATVRGEAESGVNEIVDGYEKIGRALMAKQPVPFTARVQSPAADIARLLNGHITSIRFETAEFDAEIFPGDQPELPENLFENQYGAVQGRIQSLSNRRGLRFVLYDELDDHAISCYVKPGSEETMRQAWGKFASVEGIIRRNVETGKAVTVRQATIHVVPEGDPNEFREAIGCAPAIPGSISAEEAVRKIRDV